MIRPRTLSRLAGRTRATTLSAPYYRPSTQFPSHALAGLRILILFFAFCFSSSSLIAVPPGCDGPDGDISSAETCPTPGPPPSFSVPSSDSDGSYNISWGVATYSPSRYELYERVGSTYSWNLIHNSSSRTKTITGKSNGQYSYRVRGCNSYGCGSYSAIKTVQVTIPIASPPGVPTSLTVPNTDDDGSYTVSWGTASGSPTRYELYEMTSTSPWNQIYSGLLRSFTISGRGGSVYSYRVRACNNYGCSGYTSTQSVDVACIVGPDGNCQPYLAEFKLLTLNTWLLSTFLDINAAPYRSVRAIELTKRLMNLDFDIIALQETFDEEATGFIFSGLGQEYPTQVHSRPIGIGAKNNGGLSLLSRFPSVDSHNEPYTDCDGADCLAKKGFTYNLLQLDSGILVGIVNTHLNSGDESSDATTRWFQLRQLSQWITQNHPPEIPLIYTGDFNIPGSNGLDNGSWEYSYINSHLGASIRDAWLESYGESLALNEDCGSNFADPGYTFYTETINPSAYTSFSGICPKNTWFFASLLDEGPTKQRLDYIFVDNGISPYHIEISDTKTVRLPAFVCIIDPLSIAFPSDLCGDNPIISIDVSDHFGLTSTIKIYPATATTPLAGFNVSEIGLSATFTDTSSGNTSISSWLWRFGDDSVSTSQHPSHTYSSAGTYLVHLTVTDSDGLTDTFSQSVTVTPPLSVSSILGPSTVTAGSSTWSVNVSGGKQPIFYQWFVTESCIEGLVKKPVPYCGWNPVGNNSPSLTLPLYNSSTIKVIVTDYDEVSYTRTKDVTVQ